MGHRVMQPRKEIGISFLKQLKNQIVAQAGPAKAVKEVMDVGAAPLADVANKKNGRTAKPLDKLHVLDELSR